MAVHDAEPGHAMTLTLEQLLKRARQVKKQTAIDPPLQISDLISSNEPLLGPVMGDPETHKTIIESSAKNVFYAILASTQIDDPAFVNIWNLLDILQYCGDQNQCSPQLVLLLIEELLDGQTIEGCRVVFNYLESRREIIISTNSKNKDLVILRSCNELLRRLSRAEDAVFCGRVYIFLFQSFPLGDKSSVNLRGDFHVENVTTFEEYLKSSEPEGEPMETDDPSQHDDKETQSEEGSAKPVKTEPVVGKNETMSIDELYPVFWSLQHAFSNPPRLFEEANFKEFQKGLEATLAKFKEVPKVIQASDSEGKRGVRRKSGDDHHELANTFNPKYLTSRDLFKLELSDLAFQRHILVQALILIDFIFSLTEKSKKKAYYENAQRAMQYDFTLGEREAEWASGIKTQIANYLQEGSDGKFYYRMVDTVLSRDKNWVRWKMENCQPFTRDPVSTKDFLEAKSGAQKLVDSKAIVKPKSFGLNLEFLTETQGEKGLERLKTKDRFAVPSVESYAREVEDIQFTLDMAETEEDKRQLKEDIASKTWRGLRIAMKDRLSLFDKLEEGKHLGSLFFQPGTGVEAAPGEDGAPSAPEDRDAVPQEQHQSVEEQRAD
jgi:THO complex subunit 1